MSDLPRRERTVGGLLRLAGEEDRSMSMKRDG